MKRLLITAMFCGVLTTTFAQVNTDTATVKIDTTKKKKVIKITFGGDGNLYSRYDSAKTVKKPN
ncbi:MAG: hypothetical protein EOP42_07365, partial [Sphingobacteriaceae bacterium]